MPSIRPESGDELPPGVTQAQLDEIRAFNESVTKAGGKGRNFSRGGAPSAAQGRGMISSSFISSPVSRSPPIAGSSGSAMKSTYVFGHVPAAPCVNTAPHRRVTRSSSVRMVSNDSRCASSHVGRRPYLEPAIQTTNAAPKPRFALTTNATPSFISAFQPFHLAKHLDDGSILDSSLNVTAVSDVVSTSAITSLAQAGKTTRQRVFSNMGQDDKKVLYAAHLVRQKDSKVAEAEIQELVGVYESMLSS
jgi:hypothetical protein